MTKVVVDTNVFMSSFLGGKPKKIIDLWKDGKIDNQGRPLTRDIKIGMRDVLKYGVDCDHQGPGFFDT